MRTVIFDLDGTLADTSGDLIAAANAVLTKQGCGSQLDFESDRLLAFQGGREMLRMGLERAGRAFEEKWVARTGYDMFIKEYEAALSVHTILYPECEESLAKLAETGWRLGVCTNKPETLARMLLTDLGVMDRFGALIGADTLSVRKPHP
ncbi:MAG: HAD hydrolase-like protein, partial [Rhodobacteraceae bacterium]|nr:HAD hydrolase-like protein [Paracoccaceae bacterium]